MTLESVILELLHENPRVRKPVLVISSLLGAVSLAAILYLPSSSFSWAPAALGGALLALVGSAVAFLSVLMAYAGFRGLSVELRAAESNRRELEKTVRNRPRDAYAHLELGAAELRVFYAINQAQARSSFRFGVFSVVVGLIFVLLGVFLFYGQQAGMTPAAISSVGGVIAEFVGASSLYLYNRVQSQSLYYHDYLGRYQRLMVAVSICNSIEDKELRDTTRRTLALEILTRDSESQGAGNSRVTFVKPRLAGISERTAPED